MKKLIIIFLSFLICLCAFAESKVPQVEVTMPFHKGVNLSSWLEPQSGGTGSTLFGKSDFEDIKSMGADIVRVPVHFEEFSSGSPDYKVPDWLWNLLDNAVGWCTELQLYMIIDFHNDCDGNSRTRSDIEKVLKKIWPQIAGRYKNSSEYILYEIYNEPHMKSGNQEADISKWNKIQGNILSLIRTIDKKHLVIVGAESWNSVDALLKLPDYEDDKIIYNFHDYSPFCFSHQGATWTYLADLKGIPFPYDKERMPALPKNASSSVKWAYDNYEKDSSEAVLVKPLDAAVAFANKRKVALMCNEYGVLLQYPENEERINWYRMKTGWMDERNIIRVSWDYKGSFGIFNSSKMQVTFPNDVNVELIEAMGYKIPEDVKTRSKDWLQTSYKNGAYEIYRNGLAKNISMGAWLQNSKVQVGVNRISENKDLYISIPSGKAYDQVNFTFYEPVDLSSLVENDFSLEFEVKTSEKDFKLEVYFLDKENVSEGKEGFEWRAGKNFSNREKLNDGKWHKVRIPLKQAYGMGAWNNGEQKWFPDEGLFKWNKVDKLIFSLAENGQLQELSIRNIVITQ